MKRLNPIKFPNQYLVYLQILIGISILALPLVSRLLFDTLIEDTKIYFIGFVSILFLVNGIFNIRKVFVLNLNLVTGTAFLLFLWITINFIFISKASFFFIDWWVIISYFLLYYSFINFLKDSQKSISILLIAILLFALVQAGVSILQYADIIDVSHKYFKLLGSFTTPNFLATYISFGIYILGWLFFTKRISNRIQQILAFLSLLILTWVLMYSKSRGSWLALGIALLVLLLSNNKIRLSLKRISFLKKSIITFIVLVCLFFSGKTLYQLKPDSVNGRLLAAKITIENITEEPVFGHGLFSFAKVYNKTKADYYYKNKMTYDEIKLANYLFNPYNDYLLTSLELGILALLLIFIFFFLLIRFLKLNDYSKIAFVLLIHITVFALFNSPLQSITLMSIVILSLAILTVNSDLKSIRIPYKWFRVFQLLLIAIISTTLLYISNFKLQSKHLKNTIQSISAKPLDMSKIKNVANISENNGFSDFFLGKRLYLDGHKIEGYKYMKKGFSKNYAPIIGKGLADYYRIDGNYAKAEQLYKINIGTEPYRYEARMNLFSLYKKTNRYNDAIRIAEEIADLAIKIPSRTIGVFKKRASKYIETHKYLIAKGTLLSSSFSKKTKINSIILNSAFNYQIYLPPIHKIETKLSTLYILDSLNNEEKNTICTSIEHSILNNTIQPIALIFIKLENEFIDKEFINHNIKLEQFLCKELKAKLISKYPLKKEEKYNLIVSKEFFTKKEIMCFEKLSLIDFNNLLQGKRLKNKFYEY